MVTKPTAIGWAPQDIKVILSYNQNFIFEIEPDDLAAIVTGTICELVIYPIGTQRLALDDWGAPLDTWPATIADGIITWDIPYAQTNVIPNKAYARVMLTFPDNEPYCWAHGLVERQD